MQFDSRQLNGPIRVINADDTELLARLRHGDMCVSLFLLIGSSVKLFTSDAIDWIIAKKVRFIWMVSFHHCNPKLITNEKQPK